MPEQSHYDVIRVVIGVETVPTPGDKTVFAPSPTKTAEFEVKNRRAHKRGRDKSITFAVCYFCLFFKVIKQI